MSNTNEMNGGKTDPATVGTKRTHSEANEEWDINPTAPVVIKDEPTGGHGTWQNNPFYDYAFALDGPRKGWLNAQGHLDMNDDYTISPAYTPPTAMELNWCRNMSAKFGGEMFLAALVYD